MAAHRYWRIEIFGWGSSINCALSKIQMRESQGGADVTGSGTASACSTDSSYSVEHAFDDDINTFWAKNSTVEPVWVKYDFGSGITKDIEELVLTARNDSYGVSQSPYIFTLSFSDDDSDYTIKYLWDDHTAWTAGLSRTFNGSSSSLISEYAGASKRYWRVLHFSMGSGLHSAVEIQMRDTESGSDVTGSGAASDQAGSTSYPIANAFDDNAGTLWSTYGGSPATYAYTYCWLQYDFGPGVTKNIIEMAFTARSGYATENLSNLIVLCSDDGLSWEYAWIDHQTDGFTAWTSGETRTYTNPDPPSGFFGVVDATLSNLQISAFSGSSVNIVLPELQVDILAGSAVDATLPELRIDTPDFVYSYSNVNLPALSIKAYEDTSIKLTTGEYPDYTLTLPEFRIDAAFGEVLTLNEKFPTLEIAAYSGIVSNDLTLPDLSLTSNVIETIVSEDVSCTAVCLLPPVLITTESLTGNFDFDLTLPGLLVQANFSSLINITLAKVLPELRIDATYYGNSLILDELLPTITMRPLGYGDDSGSAISTLIESGRFDDILLRYDRWAI